MKVIAISENDPSLSVRANADDIIEYQGVVYRVIVSPEGFLCRYCACYKCNGCECMPFNCLSSDKYPHGTHLVRVCPEEGGEK